MSGQVHRLARAVEGQQALDAAGLDGFDHALQRMVEAIQAGRIEGLLPFNRAGEPVHLA